MTKNIVMVDIKSGLKKGFDEVQISKLLYDNQVFYKRLDFWILSIIAVSGGLIYFFPLKHPYAYFILYLVAIGFGGFMIINKGIKKILIRKNFSVNKGVLKPWESEEYQENKIKVFYDSLIINRLLHDTKSDIELLEEYKKLCNDESNFFKTNQSYLIGGGILVLFVLPVWSEIIKVLLQESSDFIETLKLTTSLLASIGLSIYLLSNIDKALIQFANSTSRKYKEIARLLELLRLNLLIKYSKKDKKNC